LILTIRLFFVVIAVSAVAVLVLLALAA